MTGVQRINRILSQYPENQLIFASKLYCEQLSSEVTEGSYYKTLERLCKAGSLCKIAKGTYYRPKPDSDLPPSQQEIVSAFTEPDMGTIVGPALYRQLQLSQQPADTVEVLSCALEQQTRSIGNVALQFYKLTYTPQVRQTVQMMDVLQNFHKIPDLDHRQFLALCEAFASTYDDAVFDEVCQQMKYQKRTISFLQTILNHYQIPNKLHKYLSTLSEYKHPTMEQLQAAAGQQ